MGTWQQAHNSKHGLPGSPCCSHWQPATAIRVHSCQCACCLCLQLMAPTFTGIEFKFNLKDLPAVKRLLAKRKPVAKFSHPDVVFAIMCAMKSPDLQLLVHLANGKEVTQRTVDDMVDMLCEWPCVLILFSPAGWCHVTDLLAGMIGLRHVRAAWPMPACSGSGCSSMGRHAVSVSGMP